VKERVNPDSKLPKAATNAAIIIRKKRCIHGYTFLMTEYSIFIVVAAAHFRNWHLTIYH
jgi:hypothetical protein